MSKHRFVKIGCKTSYLRTVDGMIKIMLYLLTARSILHANMLVWQYQHTYAINDAHTIAGWLEVLTLKMLWFAGLTQQLLFWKYWIWDGSRNFLFCSFFFVWNSYSWNNLKYQYNYGTGHSFGRRLQSFSLQKQRLWTRWMIWKHC